VISPGEFPVIGRSGLDHAAPVAIDLGTKDLIMRIEKRSPARVAHRDIALG
jgi:hypothetical protein